MVWYCWAAVPPLSRARSKHHTILYWNHFAVLSGPYLRTSRCLSLPKFPYDSKIYDLRRDLTLDAALSVLSEDISHNQMSSLDEFVNSPAWLVKLS
ncbi:hypothetical protein HW555_002307 [Spodoptera exigua]|uniref:Uncharacterized protein n=1 Tax=Spodoptera exigua TaxID=7107 RepID=A0A835LEG4_SPOEX|nr:hypothetical protein HW555_002307 [Spodoptera exigua]